MSSLNKVQLIGRLGKDPEIRHTQQGGTVANLSLSTSERWKDQSGNQQERTEWHRVVVFGKLAEIVEKYLKKGSNVYFEGKLQTRSWKDNNGQDRYTTEIVVTMGGSMVMLGNGNGAQQHSEPSQARERPVAVSQDAPLDDDIPF